MESCPSVKDTVFMKYVFTVFDRLNKMLIVYTVGDNNNNKKINVSRLPDLSVIYKIIRTQVTLIPDWVSNLKISDVCDTACPEPQGIKRICENQLVTRSRISVRVQMGGL